MGHSEKIFDDHNVFDPSRWLDKKKKYHPFSTLPFGFGSRNCVDRRVIIYIFLIKVNMTFLNEKLKFYYYLILS